MTTGILLFALLQAAAAAPTLTLTPWCSNSFRVQLTPSAAAHPATAVERARLAATLHTASLTDLPAALIDECGPGAPVVPKPGGSPVVNGNLGAALSADGITLSFFNVATQREYFSARAALAEGALPPYLAATLNASAGDDKNERFFGLGQGGWTDNDDNGCPIGEQRVVPLQRNGQTVNLQQTKFHVSIPFVYSSAGYGFLWNLPGYGSAHMGAFSVGGMEWQSDAVLEIDYWVSGLTGAEPNPGAIYRQYADATGHAPPLRAEATLFWQSRNRYKSSAVAEAIAARFAAEDIPVGMLVIDFYNQVRDGDFAPNAACFPSVAELTASVRATVNASVMFSFWPEVLNTSSQYEVFRAAGCLANADLGGFVLDTTIPSCRDLLWNEYLLPHYYAQGVTSYWLDETDGEGTAGGDGTHGYDTSFGPAAAYSQLWIGSWLSTFSMPVSLLGDVPPLVLTRGVWAGGQRYGVVLWSSDIDSTFETLAAQVPLGVHASMSGIPWWTSDVGGFGCSIPPPPNNSSYMQELIVRWYQLGLFSSIFRTHGCRHGGAEPEVAPCIHVAGSCGFNEPYSYGNSTAVLLISMIRFRAEVLAPYISALARNVSAEGVPTMRPLWYEFPSDAACYDVDDEFMLGPLYLVAPVTTQGATNRTVVFPAGASWQSVWDAAIVEPGGVTKVVQAPLDIIPAYMRV